MPTCFVIQPFDNGPFDQRYDDTLVPAITEAGLEPYRVDRDPAAFIPVADIEDGIRRADVCLADISLPNPNVWFEVGYSIASGKPVVFVCAHDPEIRFPFDIQHRAIIVYRKESSSDFETLKKQIRDRLQAALQKEKTLGRLVASRVIADVEGLTTIEIATLATVAASANGPNDPVSAWSIKQDLDRAGYTGLAATLGLGSLLSKGMLDHERVQDRDGDYIAYVVTPRGITWLLENQERLVLRKHSQVPVVAEDDDIPF